VHGVDIVQETVDTINRGEIHIVEPELDTFIKAAVGSGRLRASTEPAEADVFIIAVPPPFHSENQSPITNHQSPITPTPNIDFVISATEAIAPYVKEGDIVILESTSPVGTTDKVQEILAQIRPDVFPSIYHQPSTLHCRYRTLHLRDQYKKNRRALHRRPQYRRGDGHEQLGGLGRLPGSPKGICDEDRRA
jgi:UDP-glucose 6-dehydrogenase